MCRPCFICIISYFLYILRDYKINENFESYYKTIENN